VSVRTRAQGRKLRQLRDTGTPRSARIDPRAHDQRAETFSLKLFTSELAELKYIAAIHNRTPGEQLRAILHTTIRQERNAPHWIPPELDRRLEGE